MSRGIAFETALAPALVLLACLPCLAQKVIEPPVVSFTEGLTAVITTGPQLLTTSRIPVKVVFGFAAQPLAEAVGHLAHRESGPDGGVDYFSTSYSGRIYSGNDVSNAVEFHNLPPQQLATFSPVIVPDPADGRIFYELTASVSEWKWGAEYGLYQAVISITPVEAPELIGMSVEMYPSSYLRTTLLQRTALKGRRLHRLRPSRDPGGGSPPVVEDAPQKEKAPLERAAKKRPVRRVRKK